MAPQSPPQDLVHALSFDIEDWFHMVEIKACSDSSKWGEFPTIVQKRVWQILGILEEFDVRATFFILGWIAEKYPELVRRIADAGHELGTHSFWHRKVYDLTPEVFYEDMLDSIEAIESAGGNKVRGFRAPSFSIVPGTEWAFSVLKKVGIEYDASLFPARRAHGGYPCDFAPHLLRIDDNTTIAEFPMSVMRLGPLQFCFSGGGYFRLLPGWLIERGIDKTAALGRPTVVYLHPRDFAVDCPRVVMAPHRRFKCYVGRRTTEPKLRRLLAKYRFSTCADVLQAASLLPPDRRSSPSANYAR